MKILLKIYRQALLILFAMAFLFMVFTPRTASGSLEIIAVVLLAILLFFVLRWIYQKLSALTKKKQAIILFSLFAVFLLAQILWVTNVHLMTFGDPEHVFVQATRLFEGNHTWDTWILQYPNLVPLVTLNLGFLKVAAFLHVNFWAVFYAFNILINTAIWAMVARILWTKNSVLSIFSLLLVMLVPSFSIWLITIGYSDGIAMLALVSLFWIFKNAANRDRLSILQFIAVCLIFGVGYLLRPNIIVLFLATLIIGVFAFWQRKKYNALWKICAWFFLALIIGTGLSIGLNHTLAGLVGYDLNNKNVFPVWNWIYESVNFSAGGMWTPQDRYYTLLHTGYDTAKAADIAGIWQRITHYNVLLLPLWLMKFGILWTSGTFQTTNDYAMYSQVYNWTQAPAWLSQNIAALTSAEETFAKALMALLLFAIIYSLWKKKKELISSFGFLVLSILGISLFHALIWEVKERYQFMTLALLILAACICLPEIFETSSDFRFLDKQLPKIKIAFPILAIVSLILMATVLRSQARREIIQTSAVRQLTADGNYASDKKFAIPVGYKRFELTTFASDSVVGHVEKNIDGTWTSQRLAPVANTGAENQANPSFIPNAVPDINMVEQLTAGDYRISLTNPNKTPLSFSLMEREGNVTMPYWFEVKPGETVTFAFSISHFHYESRYPWGLIGSFAVIYLLGGFFIYRQKSKNV